MNMHQLVHACMDDNKRKRQLASDITIDFIDSIQTSLTIEQINLLKESAAIAHSISHRLPPITRLRLNLGDNPHYAHAIMAMVTTYDSCWF